MKYIKIMIKISVSPENRNMDFFYISTRFLMSTYHIQLHTYEQFKKYIDPFYTELQETQIGLK